MFEFDRMELHTFLDELNQEIFNNVVADLGPEPLGNTVQELWRDLRHVRSQIGKAKYVLLSELHKSLKENLAPENKSNTERQSNTTNPRVLPIRPSGIKKENLFNAKSSKKTKISDISELSDQSDVTKESNGEEEIQIKKEKEEMPAPKTLPPRKKKVKAEPQNESSTRPTRSTRSKARAAATKPPEVKIKVEPTRKDSDVNIINSTIPVVQLDDSMEPEPESSNAQNNEEPIEKIRGTIVITKNKSENGSDKEIETRKTRTKTRAAKAKRDIEDKETEQPKKKSRSNSSKGKTSTETVYEDAQNATYVTATDATFNVNATYVTKSDVPPSKPADDDSKKKPGPKSKTKTQKAKADSTLNKLNLSPIMNKVQAFEKLTTEPSCEPSTKSKIDKNIKAGTVKEKSKVYTPQMTSRLMTKTCSSTSKIPKTISTLSCEVGLLGKTTSELKASQAEYRERERKRAQEAAKKKEALLKAQAEEIRKKREEKQMKAQQQRENLEKDKLQKLKEEKEKLKEEARLKKEKQAAAIKLLKEKEEALRAEEKQRATMKEKQKEKPAEKLPDYMISRAPLLPTEDCYDSDDERCPKQITVPEWCTDQAANGMQQVMLAAGEACKNTFFCCQANTPDLIEIFETIDSRKLKRTSSAIWKKPPRYTLMPVSDQPSFEEEEDD